MIYFKKEKLGNLLQDRKDSKLYNWNVENEIYEVLEIIEHWQLILTFSDVYAAHHGTGDQAVGEERDGAS
jgi:hypothetical protein